MVGRIDAFFDKYAQIIIKIADFFGVDNKSLIYMWIIVSCVVFGAPLKDYIIVLTTILILTNLLMLNVEYSTNDIMAKYGKADFLRLFNIYYRVFLLAFSYYAIFQFYKIFSQDFSEQINFLKVATVFKLFLPLTFWLYFLQHPDLRCKKRLKERIKSAIKKFRASFPAPVPAPSAIPIIISNFFKF